MPNNFKQTRTLNPGLTMFGSKPVTSSPLNSAELTVSVTAAITNLPEGVDKKAALTFITAIMSKVANPQVHQVNDLMRLMTAGNQAFQLAAKPPRPQMK